MRIIQSYEEELIVAEDTGAREWVMVTGGVCLLKKQEDGTLTLATVAMPAAVHNNLRVDHVQGIWTCINNSEPLQMAMAGVAAAAGQAYTELGNMKAFEDGEIDDEDLEILERMDSTAPISAEKKAKIKHGGRKEARGRRKDR